MYLAKAVLNTREIDLRENPFVEHSGEGLPSQSLQKDCIIIVLSFLRAVNWRKPDVLVVRHSVWCIVMSCDVGLLSCDVL